jgi:FkbM family methyltransferase
MLSTRGKINIARTLNVAIVGTRSLVGRHAIVTCRRRGLKWRLDLNEGIDFAIYLGLYQKIPRRIVESWIPPGSLVLDIGANIGSHALPLARQVGPYGRVVAIEPTVFAFSKLCANVALNPELNDRMILVQAALNDGATDQPQPEFYSRWPLHRRAAGGHRQHLGQLESTQGARIVALDALLGELRYSGRISGPVKFVKLDVDGYELQVLRGGRQSFMQEKPAVLMEVAPYTQDEVPGRFEALLNTLESYGYHLEDGDSGQLLPMSAEGLRKLIKDGAGIEALARSS